jgi:energy-coupling factor transporter ATP-binding protein EcfA2
MKIVKLTAEHFKRISAVEIVPTGDVVQITGANGSGKTSVLDAIYAAVAGAGDLPKQPIHKGEESARIRLDLGDIVITRKFTEGGKTTLTVEATDGARYPSPQKMLDSLVGSLTFDPLAFTRMAPAERSRELRRLVPLDIDVDTLQAQNNADFENRRDLNRRHKEVQGAVASMLPPSPDLPDEPIDTEAILRRMEEGSKHNIAVDRQLAERRDHKAKVAQLRETVQYKRDHAARMMAEADDLEQSANDAETSMAKMPPVPEPVDLTTFRTEVADAKMVNDAIEKRRQRVLQEERAAILKAEAEALTKAMEDRKAEIRASMERATMPIAGLTFDDDGEVLFNGVPFDQASGAEQLRVSMAIAMAGNPKLRVLRIKDGSLLDAQGMAIVAEMAREHDYQFWIERVATERPIGIIMEDGAVRETVGADA